MQQDFSRRVRAARAYADISRATLADGLTLTKAALERLEAGLNNLTEEEATTVVRELSKATRLPEAFFTGDYARP
jgi:ribosome-binding protein aMBF1 (putative translation factor)